MKSELIVQNSGNGTIYDFTEVVGKISLSDKLEGEATKLTFSIKVDEPLDLENGSVVRYTRNGNKKFYGYVFAIGDSNDETISITAYDQRRYFKNKDTYVFGASPLEDRLKKIVNDFKLRLGKIELTNYSLPAKIYDDKTIGDILQDGIDMLLINSGKWFAIKDNFGELELLDLKNLKTNIVITDSSLLSNYKYEEKIDSDTYNQIKLVRDNETTSKRDVYIIKDSSTQKVWGLLQYYEVVDEKSNTAQIKERAEQLLKLYNRPTQSLNLDCLGDERIVAGSGVYIDITSKNNRKFEGFALVKSVEHKYERNSHTMSLELEVYYK